MIYLLPFTKYTSSTRFTFYLLLLINSCLYCWCHRVYHLCFTSTCGVLALELINKVYLLPFTIDQFLFGQGFVLLVPQGLPFMFYFSLWSACTRAPRFHTWFTFYLLQDILHKQGLPFTFYYSSNPVWPGVCIVGATGFTFKFYSSALKYLWIVYMFHTDCLGSELGFIPVYKI